MRLGYYTPHFVNWTGSASNARMPLLDRMVSEGHHLVLMRQKYQRRRNGYVELPAGTFTQLNLENEASRHWVEGEPHGQLSKTDTAFRTNVLRGSPVAWPEIDVLVMEPFAVFLPNQIFQMQMVAHYAGQVPIVMYDMDMGHGGILLGRMKKSLPEVYARVEGNVRSITCAQFPIYQGLGVRQFFLPFGPVLPEHVLGVNPSPEVDLVFVGRDLNRRPRMRELVLEPSKRGVSVRVHGRYPPEFMAKYPDVQWREEVSTWKLAEATNAGMCTVVVLQSRQAKLGFYPIRIATGAMSGPGQFMDASILGGEKYALDDHVVASTDDVVESVENYRSATVEQRAEATQLQHEMFAECNADIWADTFIKTMV